MDANFKYRLIERVARVKVYGLHNFMASNKYAGIQKFVRNILIKYESLKFHLFKSVSIPQVEIVITTRCSLRCKECANFIPLIKNKVDFSYEQLTSDLNSLLKKVTSIQSVLLLGGEPLLHKNLAKIFQYCCEQRKIKQVYIVSNGTIVPSSELVDVMRKFRNKSYFWLSNYSSNASLSNRLHNEKIINLLKENKIKAIYHDDLKWIPTSKFVPHNRSSQELINYYKGCRTTCVSMIEGKIFPCPRASAFYFSNPHKLPSKESNEYVDVREDFSVDDVINFYSKQTYKICDYCSLLEDFKSGRVIPAIQLNKEEKTDSI